MPSSAQAQAGFEIVVKVSDGDAAHTDTSQNDFNDCIAVSEVRGCGSRVGKVFVIAQDDNQTARDDNLKVRDDS
jgi:hypothetical protein